MFFSSLCSRAQHCQATRLAAADGLFNKAAHVKIDMVLVKSQHKLSSPWSGGLPPWADLLRFESDLTGAETQSLHGISPTDHMRSIYYPVWMVKCC